MRIALYKSFFAGPVSGADETLVTYASELKRTGHDVTVLLLYPFSEDDPYCRRLRAAGVPVEAVVERAWLFSSIRLLRDVCSHLLFVFVLLSRFPGHVRKIWQMLLRWISGRYYGDCRGFLRRRRFDVIHALTPDSGTIVMIRAAEAEGVPLLYQELGTPHHVPALRSSYDQLAKVSALSTRVAALSPKLALEWEQRLPTRDGIDVIPLIVEPPTDWRLPRRPVPFEVVIGFAARIEEAKGIHVLIDAFAQLCRRSDRTLLRIAGAGPQSYHTQARVRALDLAGRCDFVGHYTSSEGRGAFLQSLDLFVLPSFAEGTPNSVIEAMAAGLPVIATRIGGLSDLVTDQTGILVEPGNADALARAMERLAGDPVLRQRMGGAARRRYELLFSREAVMPLLQRTYRQLAGIPAAPSRDRHPWEIETETLAAQ